ncbi:hypothetical protein HDV04_000413 [Boothiomyces sp. JEL0838]|nr:hypothetical protein HDV04_000413 [Boothiomyces sp. JEL0838]
MNTTDDITASAGEYVYGFGWTFMHLSIVCSAFVVFRITLTYYRRGMLPLTLRFPFYIALTDLLLSFSLMLDQYHNVLFHKDWEGFMCNFTATLVGVAVFSNMILVCCVTLITYSSVVRQRPLDLGSGDWKLVATVLGCSLTLAGVSIPSTGKSKYWCYGQDFDPQKSIQIMSAGLEFLMFGAILFFSAQVYLVINRNIQMLVSVGGGHGKANQSSLPETKLSVMNENSVAPSDNSVAKTANESQISSKKTKSGKKTKDIKQLSDAAARKILMFILNYFIQCGGILNFIAITVNEGWSDAVDVDASRS